MKNNHPQKASGDDHNLIKLLRRKGMSQQEAYTVAGDAVQKRYLEWYVELSKVPHWGEEVNMQVQKYIRGCQDIVLANLNWRYGYIAPLLIYCYADRYIALEVKGTSERGMNWLEGLDLYRRSREDEDQKSCFINDDKCNWIDSD
jgi:hypothetical protein